MSNTPIDQLVRYRLAILEDLVDGARGHGSAIQSFRDSWRDFIDLYIRSSQELEPETINMVEAFTATTTALFELDIAREKIHDDLDEDITKLAESGFKKLSIEDTSDAGAHWHKHKASTRYIEPCCKWILAHLHNPYPAKYLKERFAQRANTSTEVIDAWFVDARKRIGWVALRRAFFQSRADMLRVTMRYFKPPRARAWTKVNDTGNYPNLDSEFAQMQATAHFLFAPKFFPTTLASTIEDKSNKDTAAEEDDQLLQSSASRSPSIASSRSPSPTVPTTSEKRKLPDDAAQAPHGHRRPFKRHRATTSSVSEAGPSSASLPPNPNSRRKSRSSLPSLAGPSCLAGPSSLEKNAASPSDEDTRKRRHSCSSDYDSDSSHSSRGKPRRRLTESPRPERGGEIASHAKDDQTDDGQTTLPHAMPVIAAAGPSIVVDKGKRKRRLSEADDRLRKRPQHAALVVPRLQTVSNPLPLPSGSSDPQESTSHAPAEGSPSTPSPDMFDLGKQQSFDIEMFDFSKLATFNDYLGQLNAAPEDSGNTVSFPEPSSALPTSSNAGNFGSTEFNFDFTLGSTDKAPEPSFDDLLADIASNIMAPEANWQIYSSNAGDQSTGLPVNVNQLFDPTFANMGSIDGASEGNAFDYATLPGADLSLASSSTPSLPTGSSHNASAPAFDSATQAEFAMRKIQSLQAQIEMYRNQLALYGIPPS